MIKFLLVSFIYLFSNCNGKENKNFALKTSNDSIIIHSQIDSLDKVILKDTLSQPLPNQIIDYAKTLIDVPYKYGSTCINVGLDCSGYHTSVYNHFNTKVPRSSVDFANYGKNIAWKMLNLEI